MTIKTLLGAAALALTIAAPAANAATYNFSWSADPAADPTITSSDDPTITAVGSFNIDVLFGNFSKLDFSNVSIVVSGDTINDFTVTDVFDAFGTVELDGTVSFGDFALLTSTRSFGCGDFFCGLGPRVGVILAFDGGSTSRRTEYRNGSDALASLNAATSLPAAPVPLPAGGLLLLSGLVIGAALKRRKKRTA